MKILIALLGLAWFIVCGFSLCKDNEILPKWINYSIVPGAIITFILIPSGLLTIRVLDVAHPVYSDGGMSTLSMMVCAAGGVLLAGTFAFFYKIFRAIRGEIIYYKQNRKR